MYEWISVNDKLPRRNGRYLCFKSSYGIISIYSFAHNLKKVDEYDFDEEKSGWYHYDSEYGYYEVSDITHWMPLPKPPKGGDT